MKFNKKLGKEKQSIEPIEERETNNNLFRTNSRMQLKTKLKLLRKKRD